MTEAGDDLSQDFDVACLGTSPLILSRAAEYARSGARIVMVDRGVSAGGAWRAPNVLGFDNVEIGVHLIENRPRICDYLAAMSGVAMVADRDRVNRARLFGVGLPFPFSRTCLHILAAAKALLRGQPQKAALMARSAARASMNMNVPFAYPAGGCGQLVAGLAASVKAAGGRILLGVEVTGLDLDIKAGTVELRLACGRKLKARRAILSSRAYAPVTPSPLAGLHIESAAIDNAVLHFSGRWTRPTGYIELIGDPVIKRVRDVGAFAIPRLPEGEGLATIQMRHRKAETEYPDADALLNQLVRRRLVAPGATAIGIEWHTARLDTLSEASLRRLEQASGGLVEALPSTDLAEELANRLRGESFLWLSPTAPALLVTDHGQLVLREEQVERRDRASCKR